MPERYWRTAASIRENTFKSFSLLIREIPKPYLLGIVLSLTVLLSAIRIYSADIIKKAIDAAVIRNTVGLSREVFLIIGVVAVEALGRFTRKCLLGRYTEGGLAHLRERIAAGLAFAPLEILEERHSGDYVSRVTNDLARVEGFLRGTLVNIAYQPLTAAGAISYCLHVNWKLTLLTCTVTPLMVALAVRVSRPMSEYGRQVQEKLGTLSEKSQDLIHGIEVARAFGLNQVLSEKFLKSVDESVESARRMAKASAKMMAISLGMGLVPFFICFGAGGYWVLRGEISAGSLLAFINLLNHLSWPFSQFPALLGKLKGDITAVQRVLEVLNISSEMEPASSKHRNLVIPRDSRTHLTSFYPQSTKPLAMTLALQNVQSCTTSGFRTEVGIDQKRTFAVRFENVSFSYAGRNSRALSGVDLEVRAGERVAIVGRSGSGKSTMVKLLMGFYRHYQGEIFLFENPIRAWYLYDLRRNLALVTQDTYLFPGSIRENIAYGKPGCSFDEVVAAAMVSHIHEFIMGLPQGYETDIGELGARLSGGEKQRIAIARAIIKGAPVVLLDEATSSLDSELESSILEDLTEFLKGRTVIMVTHRPSILRYVDKVFVIDEGTIVGSGSPDEILRKGGLYSRLCNDPRDREHSQQQQEGAKSGC